MNVSILNAYNNPYTNSLKDVVGSAMRQVDKTTADETQESTSVNAKKATEDTLLTSKERTFFKQMFPENSEQIDKHVLFNKNGKTQTIATTKGTVFDGIA